MLTRRTVAILVTLYALACSGCSTFSRDWRNTAAESFGSDRSPTVEGRWDGHWRSTSNGHSGKLRCIVSKSDRPGIYAFRYWGTFAAILRFHYTVEYEVEQKGQTWQMAGASDLGLLGGVFNHEATIRDGTFDATYTSKWDNGQFTLKRPDDSGNADPQRVNAP